MAQTDVLAEVARLLDELGLPWMLVGSWAASIYGDYRATHDIDVVIAYRASDVETIVAAFGADYYADADMLRSGLERGIISNIIHYETSEKVDLCPVRDTEYDRLALQRRVRSSYFGTPVWTATPEDIVLSKLHWSKSSLSEMQWHDAFMIVRLHRELDAAYLRHWADFLGVSERLEQMLSEAWTDDEV